MYSIVTGTTCFAEARWHCAAMAIITSTGTVEGIEVCIASWLASRAMRMPPPMWVAHSPGTSTRGVQGTLIVGEIASTTARSIWAGVPPASSTKAAAEAAAPAPIPSMLQPVVRLPTRKMPPILRMTAMTRLMSASSV